MRYKHISFLLILMISLTLVPTVFADTEFKVTAPKDHRISLIIRGEGKLSTIDSFHQDVGETGELTFSSSVTPELLDIIVTLKLNGEQIKNKKFESVNSGDVYTIKMIPGEDLTITSASELAALESEEEIEELKEETTEQDTENEIEEEDNKIPIEEDNEEPKEDEFEIIAPATTGLAISDIIPSGKFPYILFIALGVGALFFIIVVTRKKLDMSKKDSLPGNIDNKRLQAAEKRIKDAQADIDKIKSRSENERRLNEAQARFKKDQDEIKKLRGNI